VVEFSGVGTVWLALIIAEMHSQKYNVYFRAMRWKLVAPNPDSRQFFITEFPGVGTGCLAHIIAIIHSQEYNVYFRAMRQRLAPPDPKGA